MRILVAGMLAADPHQGGATWAVLQYVLGFRRLGHEVSVVDPRVTGREAEQYYAKVARDFALEPPQGAFDLLLNVSGMLRDERLVTETPIRVFLDLDPVFNQLWHLQGVDVGFDGHTHYATVGVHIPPTGHDWIHTLPPVVLEHWPVAARVKWDALTTVGNWRAYGRIEHEGVRYGQKAHSLRGLIDLPERIGERLAIALDIHPGDDRDAASLRANGWELLDPQAVAGTPAAYADFVRGSWAELGIAKEGYVVGRSGWFGDRSACYLASGRPVIAQDTGFGEVLPAGAGLFGFADADSVSAALEAIRFDYGRHARAARAIAEEHLDSDLVLTRLLRAVGALPEARQRSIHEATEAELARLLGAARVRRRPFEYRSSAPMAELDADGRKLLLKDNSRLWLTENARRARLEFLHDPEREAYVYRELLAGARLGTAELVLADRERQWLVVEKVDGTELYQVGELELWAGAMRWLARLHDRFLGLEHRPPLVRYDERHFRLWPEQARPELAGYDSVVERLASLPTTLVHGDLYASNVLVSNDRVCPVDWELAGVGPGVLDAAALTMGWPDAERRMLVGEYLGELRDPPEPEDVDRAALHLAVQWLGWSDEWTPPPQHAREWDQELPGLLQRAGL
jgi:hypothetical protein